MNLSHELYGHEGTFLTTQWLVRSRLGIVAVCKVPSEIQYGRTPIRYVTGENYIRCISQMAYLLGEFAIERGWLPNAPLVETYRRAAIAWELKYLQQHLRYREDIPRDRSFVLRMHLKSERALRRFGTLWVLSAILPPHQAVGGEVQFGWRE